MNLATSDKAVHLSGYQRRDIDVVDYNMYVLGNTQLSFRGPPPADLSPGSYFVCLGAAQTFGCFCKNPYPQQLEKALGLPALNLGYGGAGPEFFLSQENLLPYIQNARFVVLQVMSGRSQSNPYYSCGGLEYVTRNSDGKKMGAAQAYQELLRGNHSLRRFGRPGRFLARSLATPQARSVVMEARRQWVENFTALCKKIEPPKALLWFSKRKPTYTEKYKTVHTLFNEFPQLVNDEMVASVRKQCDSYIEVVTERGSPQPLLHKDTKEPVTVYTSNDRADLKTKPWTENKYYPSPEMHEDACSAAEAACRAFV